MYFVRIFAIFFNSSFLYTEPEGLEGVLRIKSFVFLVIAFFLSGCFEEKPTKKIDFSHRENISIKPQENVVTYAYLPQFSHSVSYERHHQLIKYLREKTGLNIRQVFPNTFDDHVRMVGMGKIDISFSNPFVYVKIAYLYHAQAFARVVEKYGAKNARSWWLRFHTQTAGCTLTAQQPENNIVRTAFQALAAVLGGTQSLHTNSMDETLALPSEKAVKIALRTQQILAYETGVINTIDPLGGSYYVEALTDKMEAEANKIFDEIDSYGGVVPAIEAGYFQREIGEAAYRYQKELDSKEKIIVGVNDFVDENEEIDIPILKVTKEVEEKQVERLKSLKTRRNNKAVEESLKKISDAVVNNKNLMPVFIEAAENYVTLGEMVAELKKHFGTYEENVVF